MPIDIQNKIWTLHLYDIITNVKVIPPNSPQDLSEEIFNVADALWPEAKSLPYYFEKDFRKVYDLPDDVKSDKERYRSAWHLTHPLKPPNLYPTEQDWEYKWFLKFFALPHAEIIYENAVAAE